MSIIKSLSNCNSFQFIDLKPCRTRGKANTKYCRFKSFKGHCTETNIGNLDCLMYKGPYKAVISCLYLKLNILIWCWLTLHLYIKYWNRFDYIILHRRLMASLSQEDYNNSTISLENVFNDIILLFTRSIES